jgi:hypothetical protein
MFIKVSNPLRTAHRISPVTFSITLRRSILRPLLTDRRCPINNTTIAHPPVVNPAWTSRRLFSIRLGTVRRRPINMRSIIARSSAVSWYIPPWQGNYRCSTNCIQRKGRKAAPSGPTLCGRTLYQSTAVGNAPVHQRCPGCRRAVTRSPATNLGRACPAPADGSSRDGAKWSAHDRPSSSRQTLADRQACRLRPAHDLRLTPGPCVPSRSSTARAASARPR